MLRSLVGSEMCIRDRVSPYFLAAHQAAEELGVELDVVGTGTNSQTSAPEKILGDYDLVLAQGLSLIHI